jgi:hypothetical protein
MFVRERDVCFTRNMNLILEETRTSIGMVEINCVYVRSLMDFGDFLHATSFLHHEDFGQ